MKLHEWRIENSDGNALPTRIVTATKNNKIASEKLKQTYGPASYFLKLVYTGTFEDKR